jgi:hypothetical protein
VEEAKQATMSSHPKSSERATKHQLNGIELGDQDTEFHKNQDSTALQNFSTSLETNTFKDQNVTPSLFGKQFLIFCLDCMYR